MKSYRGWVDKSRKGGAAPVEGETQVEKVPPPDASCTASFLHSPLKSLTCPWNPQVEDHRCRSAKSILSTCSSTSKTPNTPSWTHAFNTALFMTATYKNEDSLVPALYRQRRTERRTLDFAHCLAGRVHVSTSHRAAPQKASGAGTYR